MLQIGWEFNQAFGSEDDDAGEEIKYYQLEFAPYYRAHVYFQSILNMSRLYYNELTVDLSKFKMNIFFSVILNAKGQLCTGVGYENEVIEFLVNSASRFLDCYKVIIRDVCNLAASWTGKDAKWFDECDQSTSTEIDLLEIEIKEPDIDHLWTGTVQPYGGLCKDFLKFLNKGGNPNFERWLDGA